MSAPKKPPAQKPRPVYAWKYVGGSWKLILVPAPTTPPPANDKVRYWL